MKVSVSYCVIQNISSSHIVCVIQDVLSYLYLNSSTLSQELLSVFILLLFPAISSQDMTVYLVQLSLRHAIAIHKFLLHAFVHVLCSFTYNIMESVMVMNGV
jgi:hypothetical protein